MHLRNSMLNLNKQLKFLSHGMISQMLHLLLINHPQTEKEHQGPITGICNNHLRLEQRKVVIREMEGLILLK